MVRKETTVRTKQSGQTLVIAVLILGLLLILGIAFATIINRSIDDVAGSGRRTVAGDLSRAGAEYAHSQMLNSPLGADWRPDPTQLVIQPGGIARDPDALYLRPASNLVVEPDPVGRPGFTVVDLGGPDYMGPYTRVEFERGRALIRVRYQPNDYDNAVVNTGVLRRPGQAKNYVVVESIGRQGQATGNDPTVALSPAVQVAAFADQAALRDGLGRLKDADNSVRATQKSIAFVSLGVTEFQRFIMNVDKTSSPADLGMPLEAAGSTWRGAGPGVLNEGAPVNVVSTAGGNPAAGTVLRSTLPWDTMPGGGSMHVNGKLRLFGQHDVILNQFFGEAWTVTDGIEAGGDNSVLTMRLYDYVEPAGFGSEGWALDNTVALNGNQYDSNNPQFTTIEGALRDGRDLVDNDSAAGVGGFPRNVSRIEPPLISRVDPATGLNRYRELSENSGQLNANGQALGALGYGQGVYVNSTERANRADDRGRAAVDPSKSLPNDWLNPNNVNSQGWQGPYYTPVAPFVELLPDGFQITRDSRSTERFWRNPVDGTTSGNVTSLRFYVRTFGSQSFITNDFVRGAFNPLTATAAEWQTATEQRPVPAASRFNGVLMFEGDVRVRGVIPTNQQVSVVSMGTIYVDGSITKGTVVETGAPGSNGTSLTNQSRSMIGLFARDFVAVNTTQFFAPSPGQTTSPKSGDSLPDTANPIELLPSTSGTSQVQLTTNFLLERNGNDPSLWTPYATNYTMPPVSTTTSQVLPSYVMMSVSADNNGPSYATLDIDALTSFDTTPDGGRYLFPGFRRLQLGGGPVEDLFFNAAAPILSSVVPPPPVAVYGLGDPSVNAYPKFETMAMPLVIPGTLGAYSSAQRQIDFSGGAFGDYSLAVEDRTLFTLTNSPVGTQAGQNWLVARTAVTPFDVRIEAVMYAERGSFFVIPGPWFNSNAEDSRPAFEQNYTPLDTSDDLDTTRLDYGSGQNLVTAQRRRFERYGNSPEVPFYAEPLDVKVTLVGSISENMPASLGHQMEWKKKWGWIPRRLGGSGLTIPAQHANGLNLDTVQAVPNFQTQFDPALATGAAPIGGVLQPLRIDGQGRVLPPLPRLPVSPKLAYFGETP